MTPVWSNWLEQGLSELEDADLLRELRPLEPESPVHVRSSAGRLTLFSTNDYLGLSGHPRLREAVQSVVGESGMGPRGSPLICGYTDRHERFEARLSELESCEATLLCPTGFSANLAVMASLATPETAIFSDELNHASIIDGCRLGRRRGAVLEVYDHADPADLDARLEASEAPRKIVVTDSVFSMDGELAPLDAIVEIKDRHDALLVIDEAHGTLVFGERGAGASEHFGLNEAVDVNIGTLSKAFGTLGGFASTSQRLKRWILNRGRSYVYSTAPPLPVVEAARASRAIAREEPEIRERLWRHIDRLGDALDRDLESPIVPVIFGDEETAL
ncbi:MAG: aminotransferase class I/II-fold pyridoxal phosphate-dependent enzyme, partial [Bradymonadaceae bacterium]